VYRLSGTDLQKLGLGTVPFESAKLGLWGREAGVLSELNSTTANPSDLRSVPVRIEDGGDGQFDANDYLYFLGQSPHSWNFDSTSNRWLRPKHPYSDTQTYLVTSTEGGARMASYPVPQAPARALTRYEHVAWHEDDLVNLVGSGRAWFGEALDYTLTKQVDLGLSRLDGQSIARFVLSGAGRTTVFGPKLELRTGQGFVGSTAFQTVSGINGDTYARQFTQSWTQVSVGNTWGNAEVTLERWGGEHPLRGTVRRVEPSAFTRTSALGVEERRVNVLVSPTDPRARDLRSRDRGGGVLGGTAPEAEEALVDSFSRHSAI
jgi:hypothetical protein